MKLYFLLISIVLFSNSFSQGVPFDIEFLSNSESSFESWESSIDLFNLKINEDSLNSELYADLCIATYNSTLDYFKSLSYLKIAINLNPEEPKYDAMAAVLYYNNYVFMRSGLDSCYHYYTRSIKKGLSKSHQSAPNFMQIVNICSKYIPNSPDFQSQSRKKKRRTVTILSGGYSLSDGYRVIIIKRNKILIDTSYYIDSFNVYKECKNIKHYNKNLKIKGDVSLKVNDEFKFVHFLEFEIDFIDTLHQYIEQTTGQLMESYSNCSISICEKRKNYNLDLKLLLIDGLKRNEHLFTKDCYDYYEGIILLDSYLNFSKGNLSSLEEMFNVILFEGTIFRIE
jgi:hypothetical protein